MYVNPEIHSSYKANNIGKTIYDFVIETKPQKIIEFGVLGGYSTVALAQACRDNGFGKVIVYDLFDDYEFKKPSIDVLNNNIANYGLSDFIEIRNGNFFEWIKNPETFDLLHLDISNTGDIIDLLWDNLNVGNVLFEGGSAERDKVGWMVTYNKKPISMTRAKYEIINKFYPSISKIIWQKN